MNDKWASPIRKLGSTDNGMDTNKCLIGAVLCRKTQGWENKERLPESCTLPLQRGQSLLRRASGLTEGTASILASLQVMVESMAYRCQVAKLDILLTLGLDLE